MRRETETLISATMWTKTKCRTNWGNIYSRLVHKPIQRLNPVTGMTRTQSHCNWECKHCAHMKDIYIFIGLFVSIVMINAVLLLKKRMHWPRYNYKPWDTWKGHFHHSRNANLIPEQEAQKGLKPGFVHVSIYSALLLLIQSRDHQLIHS